MEKNLVNLIGEIREALGDDAADPRFVRTIQRFGYAFRGRTVEPRARREAMRPDCRLVSATRLAYGDSIRVGSVRLTFTAVRSRGSTATKPPVER